MGPKQRQRYNMEPLDNDQMLTMSEEFSNDEDEDEDEDVVDDDQMLAMLEGFSDGKGEDNAPLDLADISLSEPDDDDDDEFERF